MFDECESLCVCVACISQYRQTGTKRLLFFLSRLEIEAIAGVKNLLFIDNLPHHLADFFYIIIMIQHFFFLSFSFSRFIHSSAVCLFVHSVARFWFSLFALSVLNLCLFSPSHTDVFHSVSVGRLWFFFSLVYYDCCCCCFLFSCVFCLSLAPHFWRFFFGKGDGRFSSHKRFSTNFSNFAKETQIWAWCSIGFGKLVGKIMICPLYMHTVMLLCFMHANTCCVWFSAFPVLTIMPHEIQSGKPLKSQITNFKFNRRLYPRCQQE